jgi:N-carbamoylputrescine amidase
VIKRLFLLWRNMPEIPVALIQFDAVPEHSVQNLQRMKQLTTDAACRGAQWIVFHECTVHDYAPDVTSCAETVPAGPSTQAMLQLARVLKCTISFGLCERDAERYFITQVFVGPHGLIHRYRKTWLWREPGDEGYRDERRRFDAGTGPDIFEVDGLRATCFICADGEAPRCLQRAKALHPQVVFYPNNRAALPAISVFGTRAKEIRAPMLVTNRVGRSWVHHCVGGCIAYNADGTVLKKANREGREEILQFELTI